MFTEYHLEKIIQAINDAEERQTKAIVAAIKEATQHKPKPIYISTPNGLEGWLCGKPDQEKGASVKEELDEDNDKGVIIKAYERVFEKAKENSQIVPVKKPAAPKKPASKKPAPVRGRN